MRYSIVLPVTGVLVVIAAAVGMHLGESAVAQIDPSHFQKTAAPARDVTRDPRPRSEPSYASAYGWAEGYSTRDEACGGCVTPDEGDVYAAVPPVPGGPAEPPLYRDEPRFEPAAEDLAFEEERPRSNRMSRYMHYPVSADQAGADEARSGPAARPRADVPSMAVDPDEMPGL